MSDLLADDVLILTDAESRICTWVGKQRRACALKFNCAPGLGPHGSDENHIRGAHSEFAGSVFLNKFWRPAVGELDQPDVGGLVEVRSTVREAGRLIVKPADADDAPFVLIVADMDALRFRFAGWMLGRDAKLWPLLTDFGDPAHYVPQSALSSRDSLLVWLDQRAAA